MPKLHMRASIEIDVSEEQFKKIAEISLMRSENQKQFCDVDYYMLPLEVQLMIDRKQFEPCEWDDGGYIPDSWLGYDAEESGLYEVDEKGVREKYV